MDKLKLNSPLDGLLLSTVKIQTDKGSGTGFIVNYDELEEIATGYFLVTNKHVIAGCSTLQLKFHSIDSFTVGEKSVDLNKHEVFEISKDMNDLFHFHPEGDVDIAIVNINSIFTGNLPLFVPLSLSKYLVTEERISDISSVESVIFVGYPDGLMDETNLLPITRKGITATPYHFDFKGKPVFLIDASVFPGSSGSPVFIVDNRKDLRMTKARTYLLGIVSSVLVQNEQLEIRSVEIPVTKTRIFAAGQQMIDLGVVFKASEIEKLIIDFYYQTFISNPLKEMKKSLSNNLPGELLAKIEGLPKEMQDELLEGYINEKSPFFLELNTKLKFSQTAEMKKSILKAVRFSKESQSDQIGNQR